MKNNIFLFLIIFLTVNSYSQSSFTETSNKLNGIWIAENFANSFDSTKSIIKSEYIFDPLAIVGIVFNSKDTLKNCLFGNCSILHSHVIQQEKQFKVSKIDTLNPFSIIFYFETNNDTFNLYVSSFYHDTSTTFKLLIINDSLISLIQKSTTDESHEPIIYKKITSTFIENYSNPVAIYYYTRLRTFVGNYVLYDSTNKIVSKNFEMSVDGKMKGYKPFNDLLYEFSTDIYCGPKALFDLVVFYDFKNTEEQFHDWPRYVSRFNCKRIDNSTIQLLESNGRGYETLNDKVLFTLKRK